MMMDLSKTAPSVSIRNILLATDFLESSRLALDYAVAFANHFHARLTIVHAFELSREAAEAEVLTHRSSVSRDVALGRLEALASGVRRSGVDVEVDLRDGDPLKAILTAVSDHKVDLLVIGTHGVYRGLEHVLLGSNAEKILLSATCPTLSVGRHVMAGVDLDLDFSEILFVYDQTPETAWAARYARSLGQLLAIPVKVLEVLSADHSANSTLARHTIEDLSEQISADPGVGNLVQPGQRASMVDEVLRSTDTCGRSLIVLGVHTLSRWDRHLRGSIAYELVARSNCPILTVCAQKETVSEALTTDHSRMPPAET